jgi:hypothetical protein
MNDRVLLFSRAPQVDGSVCNRPQGAKIKGGAVFNFVPQVLLLGHPNCRGAFCLVVHFVFSVFMINLFT